MKIGDFKTFERMLGAPYLSRQMLSFIFVDIYGTTSYAFRKTYDAMNKSFRVECEKREVFDPGIGAIPRSIALGYLDFMGVGEEDLKARAKDYFDGQGSVLPTR